jgi:hypothetical protein
MTGAPSPSGITPDTAGITQALAAASDQVPALPDTKPLFQAMFTDRVRAAVSPQVATLWAPAKSGAAPAANDPAQPLDLFTDTGRTGISKMFGNS